MATDIRDFEERRNIISGVDVVFDGDDVAFDGVQESLGDEVGPAKLTSRPREC